MTLTPPVSLSGISTIAQNGVSPKQFAWKMFRSSDGKLCFDHGPTSIITNPAAGQTVLLDHVNKEARIIPTPPPAPSVPQLANPALPAMPVPGRALPNVPSQTVDLGKRFIEGHEVQGKRYTFQPPAPPQLPNAPGAPQIPGAPGMPQLPNMPAAPQMPGMPQLPNMPGAPQMPGAPGAPQFSPQVPGMPGAPQLPNAPGAPQLPGAPAAPKLPNLAAAKQLGPTVMEVWTATKLHVPLLSRTTGPSGQQTNVCKSAVPGEPPASAFQIPPGYKVIQPPTPPVPGA